MKSRAPFHGPTVWPSWAMTAIFVMAYGMVSTGFWVIRSVVQPADFDQLPEVVRIRGLILGAAAGAYALYRLGRFHPVFNQAYADWLKLSPWQSDRPLPLGPVLPVWQDLITLGVIVTVAGWHAHVAPSMPVLVFAVVYLGGLTFTLLSTRRWLSCIVLGFLWPVLMLPNLGGFEITGMLVAIAAVAFWGHRRSLNYFPWEPVFNFNRRNGSALQMEIRFNVMGNSEVTEKLVKVGWPFWNLSAKYFRYSIQSLNGLVLSVMTGWWSYCLIKSSGVDSSPESILFFVLIGAFARVAVYLGGVATPFNLLARIRTGRLIVPGFDRVFVFPALALLVAMVGGVLIRLSSNWYPVTEACVIGMALCILLNGGPTLQNWMLTGHVRLCTPIRRTNDPRQAIRSI